MVTDPLLQSGWELTVHVWSGSTNWTSAVGVIALSRQKYKICGAKKTDFYKHFLSYFKSLSRIPHVDLPRPILEFIPVYGTCCHCYSDFDMNEKLRHTNSSDSGDQNPGFPSFLFTVALYCSHVRDDGGSTQSCTVPHLHCPQKHLAGQPFFLKCWIIAKYFSPSSLLWAIILCLQWKVIVKRLSCNFKLFLGLGPIFFLI